MDSNDVDAWTWPLQLTAKMHRSLYPLLEPSNKELSAAGKSVLITGASGRIGRAIADAWAVAGATAIVITGRNDHILDEVAAKLQQTPQAAQTKVIAHKADITSESDITELWDTIASEIRLIDVLINCAGRMSLGTVGSVDVADWWADHETNVKGTYLMVHHFLNQNWSDDRGPMGTIISLSSGGAGLTLPGVSAYMSSKLAVMRIMANLHVEQPAVRVFSLLPGLVRSTMTAESFLPYSTDDARLSGGMSLFLSTPRADWLRGGIMNVNWDIEEMETHQDEIVGEGRTQLAFLNAELQKGGHPWKGK